jgi:uncharacterized membrane protein YfcA
MTGADQNATGGAAADQAAKRRDGAQLTAIGLGGGFFSGLFGVGGGTVMVPLMVLWRGFNEKKATGTSLLAIVIVATYAVIGNFIFGSVDVVKGVLIGIPAIGGVLFGTWIQQKIPDYVLSGMFAVLMIFIVVLYLVT